MKLTTASLRQIIKEELETVIDEATRADAEISQQNLKDRKLSGEFDYFGGEADFRKRMQQTSLGRTGEPGVDGVDDMRKKMAADRAASEKARADAQKAQTAAKNRAETVADYIERGKKLSNDIKDASDEQLTKFAQDYNEMFPGTKIKATPENLHRLMSGAFNSENFFNSVKNQSMFFDIEQAAKKIGIGKKPAKKPGFFSRFFKEE